MMAAIETRLRKLLGQETTNYFEERIAAKLGYWGERIVSQLVYAQELSKLSDNKHDKAIEVALSYLEEILREDGVLTKEAALHAERLLNSVAADAKQYEVLCVAHAHIDMNWMWPWDETVSVTLDTFRTMLNLLDEYPEFKFSQSQASIYRIVEQYAPEMLEEIKARVKEGRWEVTASHWVEADKNMPSGESLSRQMLYTKRYLSDLFSIDAETLNIDFEPDTFGHSVNVPEILASGGVRYYYHCRGSADHILYQWKAPSGRSVIVYREPTWYNDSIQSLLGAYVPQICRQTGLKTHLNVYGVGDHGGGPTRRDLERMIDMRSWPIYPRLRFGTYAEYYKLAEAVADKLPVVTGEQNFVFTGCYTSQTRIKTANRIGEATLHEAEMFNSASSLATGARYPSQAYEEAWRNVLFNQFHDILPGSGVIETREHALGLFQQTMAIGNSNRKLSMERIAANIDTSAWASSEENLTTSEGAGVGYGTRAFKVTHVERGRGSTRIVHLFNPSLHDREETVELVLWDWNSPIRALSVKDRSGSEIPYQILDQGSHFYWGHDYIRLLIQAKAPALGYNTYAVSEGEGESRPLMPSEPRVDRVEQYVLENELLRVEFSPLNASVISMLHKSTGEQLVHPERPAGLFRIIQEDAARGMTSWRVGRHMRITNLHEGVKLTPVHKGELRQSLQYELEYRQSKVKVTVSLNRGSAYLDYQLECDWQEVGNPSKGIPQLDFHWPLAYDSPYFKYDVPAGTLVRAAMDLDVPANSWALALRPESESERSSILLVTNNKYGFRGKEQSLSLSLIRGSFDPDPYPELGNHHAIRFAVGAIGKLHDHEIIELAYRYNHPMSVISGTPHPGRFPPEFSFLRLLEGSVSLSALKMPEEIADSGRKRWIVRVYETSGQSSTVKLELFRSAVSARFVDTNEQPSNAAPINIAATGSGDSNTGTEDRDSGIVLTERTATFEIAAYGLASVLLEFD